VNKGKITLTIDTGNIVTLGEKGGELVFNPKAEEAIVQLLWLEKQVGEALEMVKKTVEETGLKYNPNFTAVAGDKVKMTYQYSGAEYGYRPDEIKRFKAPFFQRKVVHALDSKTVSIFEQKYHGRLPKGIFRRERERKVVIRLGKGVEL
jgi:hypothetical protein